MSKTLVAKGQCQMRFFGIGFWCQKFQCVMFSADGIHFHWSLATIDPFDALAFRCFASRLWSRLTRRSAWLKSDGCLMIGHCRWSTRQCNNCELSIIERPQTTWLSESSRFAWMFWTTRTTWQQWWPTWPTWPTWTTQRRQWIPRTTRKKCLSSAAP